MSTLTRETKETRVEVTLGIRGRGRSHTGSGAPAPGVSTDDDFLSHMLVTLARYAGWGLGVEATGDLRHHLIEDVAITLGTVAGRDTPAECARYGEATVPMDEALVQVALDTGGRPHYEGELPSNLYDHFFRSFALNADWTVHVRVLRGRDRHHIVEAAFKALGLAIRQAMADSGDVFSTKGSVATEWADDLDETAELDAAPDPAARGEGAAADRPAGHEGAGGDDAG
jgi:imidazoleglycerol-phosphate dehydratase